MPLSSPILNLIDSEHILFGSIFLSWSNVKDAKYYNLYRDVEFIKDVSGWHAYATLDHLNTEFEDTYIQDNITYYYVVVAASETESSPISNCQSVHVVFPPHIIINQQQVAEAAYYESQSQHQFDEKIRKLALLELTFEYTFPTHTLEYLKLKVKSLKKDLPEYQGLLNQPTEMQIQDRINKMLHSHIDRMELDWQISERELILTKLQELISLQKKIR